MSATSSPAGNFSATMSVVITRANGEVENWGRMAFATPREATLYRFTHPILMLKRLYWARRAKRRIEQEQ